MKIQRARPGIRRRSASLLAAAFLIVSGALAAPLTVSPPTVRTPSTASYPTPARQTPTPATHNADGGDTAEDVTVTSVPLSLTSA